MRNSFNVFKIKILFILRAPFSAILYLATKYANERDEIVIFSRNSNHSREKRRRELYEKRNGKIQLQEVNNVFKNENCIRDLDRRLTALTQYRHAYYEHNYDSSLFR